MRPRNMWCRSSMVHRAALDINNWHLTMPILALPPAEGGRGHVGLGLYAAWVHSQTFVQAVVRPSSLAEQHARPFRGWADRVGLILEPVFLPYLQLAPIPLPSVAWTKGGGYYFFSLEEILAGRGGSAAGHARNRHPRRPEKDAEHMHTLTECDPHGTYM